MAVVVNALVITVDSYDPQTSLDDALSAAAIPASSFLDAVVISEEGGNQEAKIVILYSYDNS